MSEVDLAGLDDSANERHDPKILTSMQEVDLALKECGVGWFHVLLLSSSLVGVVAGVIVTLTTPFILPIAECDLNMSLLQKGLLNAVPYIGMTTVSIVAGFLTDTFGRKIFLVVGFGGLFLLAMVAGSSQTYEVLFMAKFCEGILFAISFSPALTITSEFCYKEIRDRVVLLRSSCMAIAQILIAAMSWGILSQDWEYSLFNGFIKLHTWNFYLYLMSLWSLSAFVLYIILPDSPKFYITQGRFTEARNVVIKMYTANTGKPAETFKYVNLWKEKEKQYIDENPENRIKSTFLHQIVTGLHNVKPMFKKPLIVYLLIISAMNFLSMVLYNVIRLWFPQLSAIVEHYSHVDSGQDLCGMLDAYTLDLKIRNANSTSDDVCVPVTQFIVLPEIVYTIRVNDYAAANSLNICALINHNFYTVACFMIFHTPSGDETYINSIILGFVAIIPFAVSGVLVNKVGKKNLYIAAGIISVCVTLSIRWAGSKVAVVALFSLDTAISQTMIGLFQALTLEVFPTTTRTLAISFIMTCGRIGTLVGNVTFPILLDMGCVVPFYTLTGVMMCVTFMALFLPKL